jgi:hypothetical protein
MMKMMVAFPHYCPEIKLIQVMMKSADSGVPKLVKPSSPLPPFGGIGRARSNQTIYQNYRSDFPPILEVNHANLSGPNREQAMVDSPDHAADSENAISGNHKFLDPQNQQASSSQAHQPSISGSGGLPIHEDAIMGSGAVGTQEDARAIPEDSWHLNLGQFDLYQFPGQ